MDHAKKRGGKKTMPRSTRKKVSKKLTPRQEAAMKKHSVHHTSKHMSAMKKMMLSGSTFTEAHKKAMKQVGR